jgi:transcription initiation factor TFIID subunit 2
MEVPVLWVRVDPEYQWIRQLTLEQSDTIWHCLLKYERDANAQLDAVEALESFQTNQTRDVFRDTILNSNFFYRVREQAAKSLAKVSDFVYTYMYMYMYIRTGIIIGVLPYRKRLI